MEPVRPAIEPPRGAHQLPPATSRAAFRRRSGASRNRRSGRVQPSSHPGVHCAIGPRIRGAAA